MANDIFEEYQSPEYKKQMIQEAESKAKEKKRNAIPNAIAAVGKGLGAFITGDRRGYDEYR